MIKNNRIATKSQAGFTLIEIMVVVVILSILAMLVVPKVMNRPEQARVVKAKQDILAIESALDLYKLDNGNYPTTEQGLSALVSRPSSEPSPQNWQPYLKRLPQDPWGHAYHYASPGEHGQFDIYTLGNSGQDEGKSTIGSW